MWGNTKLVLSLQSSSGGDSIFGGRCRGVEGNASQRVRRYIHVFGRRPHFVPCSIMLIIYHLRVFVFWKARERHPIHWSTQHIIRCPTTPFCTKNE